MKIIKKYKQFISEDFDIEKYQSFIKKYKKTRYISKNSIKSLKDFGIKEDTFYKMEKRVSECYKLFNSQDNALLYDLFLYASDEFKAKINNSQYLLQVELKWPLSGFNKYLGKNNSIVYDPKDLDDEIEVVDDIIKGINSKLNERIKKIKDDDNNDKFLNTAWSRYELRTIKEMNIFNKAKIYPLLYWKIDFDDEIDEFTDDNKQVFLKKGRSLKSFLSEEIINRYFSAIGYDNMDFEIQESNNYYSNFYSNTVEYYIKCKI